MTPRKLQPATDHSTELNVEKTNSQVTEVILSTGPIKFVHTPHVGWNWWRGRGNDRHIDGYRPNFDQNWVVYVWIISDGSMYADSARWKDPMKISKMGGTWGGEIVPPTF